MKHVKDSLAAWWSKELPADQMRQVAEHLQGCPDCAREAEQQRRLLEVLDGGAEVPPLKTDIWPAVRRRTLESGDDSLFGWLQGQGKRSQKALAAVAVAAGLFLAVMLPEAEYSGADEDWVTESQTDFGLAEASWLGLDTGSGLDLVWLAAGLIDTEEDGS